MYNRLILPYRNLPKSKRYLLSLSLLVSIITLLLVLGRVIYLNLNNTNNYSEQRLSITDRAIATAKSKLAINPKNVNSYVALCQNYIQKVRETADTTYYFKCDDLLGKASKIEPNNADVIATKASIDYGRHLFKRGLELSLKAQQLNPNKVSYYGLLGDGQLELGQYEEAIKSYQIMVDKKPEIASYNRVSYARELYGEIDGAKLALESAINASSSFPENIAYSQVELGKLQMRGNLDKAQKSFKQALNTSPGFSPALEGLGKISFARGDYKQAIQHFQQAFDNLPLAQYAIALGDTYKTQGNNNKAEQQYYLAQLAFDKFSGGGGNNDYEISTFLSSHNKETQRALQLARVSAVARPNIFSSDALAWALYRSGNYQEAQVQINDALRLGEYQPTILYHAGLIADKLGRKDQAKNYLQKAFSVDKYFLEQHFSLLDYREGLKVLERLK